MARRSARLQNRLFSRFEERPHIIDSDSDVDNNDDEEDAVCDNLDGDFSDEDAEDSIPNIEEQEEDDSDNDDGILAEVSAQGRITYFAQNRNKSDRKWSSIPPSVRKVQKSHIVRERQGVTARTMHAIHNKEDAFKTVVPEVLIQIIVRETNKKARRFFDEKRNENPDQRHRPWHDTNVDEIYALLGILIFCGAHKQSNEKLEEIFDKESRPFCRAVMSLERAQQLLRFLRFDDQRTRTDRLKFDRMAAFRDVWNVFSDSLMQSYTPSPELTIDEQLVATRGRCSFRQYIPSKPGKYGIKIFWITDAVNSYPLKGEIYVGKQPDEITQHNFASRLVNRLSAKYVNKGRTITMDNFFTSCDLALQLLEKQTTMIGTIRSNKPELPPEFTQKQHIRSREIGSSLFCFSDELTLVSYVPKKNKNVLVLSTLHSTGEVDAKTNKPKIILDYNRTKSGVDTLDHLVRLYPCKRKTLRWPMVLFFNLIDVAAVAAYRLYGFSNTEWMEQCNFFSLISQNYL